MKIDQLPLGARFQFKGRTYTKVGPMTASGESGDTMFVPKHAVLQPVSGEAPPTPQRRAVPSSVDATRVMAAFDAYHQTALTLTDDGGRALLEAARQRFLAEMR